MAVWYLILALIACVYFYFVRRFIPFATAVLQASVAAIREHHGPIVVVYLLSLVQIGWLALWAFIVASLFHAGSKVNTVTNPDGTIYQTRASASAGLQFAQFFSVFSLYWTAQVIKNIGHVTTSGVVASWWFTPSNPAPTRPAFLRAITTSIGSICFGSLLVALVSTLRALLRSARRDACRDIADCLLGMVDRFLKFFNKYAFSTIAIYGYDFLTGAKRTGELLQSELFTAVINDDLSGGVLFLGAALGGVCSGVIGLIWAAGSGMDSYLVVGLLAFLVGVLVSTLAMGVIGSAVATTFVCWASDPAALQANRNEEFGRILEAAQPIYGQKMQMQQQQQRQMQHP